MKLQVIKEFLNSKKGKAVIVTVISGAVLHFFPGAADAVAQITAYVADIAAAIGEQVKPVISVTQPL